MGVPKILPGGCEAKTTFIIMLTHYLPFGNADICTEGVEAMVDNAAAGLLE